MKLKIKSYKFGPVAGCPLSVATRPGVEAGFTIFDLRFTRRRENDNHAYIVNRISEMDADREQLTRANFQFTILNF